MEELILKALEGIHREYQRADMSGVAVVLTNSGKRGLAKAIAKRLEKK